MTDTVSADAMRAFATMVRGLRTMQREENARLGYPLASMTGMRLEGRIEGYTRVLELACQDPLND